MNIVRKIVGQLGGYRRQAVLAPLFTLVAVMMEVLIPYVMAYLIDDGISAGDMSKVLFWGVVMIACAAVGLVAGVLSGVYGAEGSTGLASNLRDALFEKVETFSFGNIDKFSTASLVTRMTTDVTNVQNAAQMVLTIATKAPFTMIASLVMCILISPSLSVIFFVALVVLGAALVFILATSMPVFNRVFERYDALNSSVQENVTAIRVVKAFVREDYENEKFGAAAREVHDLYVRAEGLLAFNNPVMVLVMYGCIIALSWLGTHSILAGEITTGQLTSLLGYVSNILTALMMLAMVFAMIAMSVASSRRIVEVLDEEPEIASPEGAVMVVADGSIDFDDVSFSYAGDADKYTLRDITLHIDSGETIGIFGGTGSGKSTFVSLISRLYDATEGSVRVGGVDVRDYDTEVLRDAVSVVLQQNTLFSGTILDNLRWGKADATLEECQAACKAACADEFIDRFPDGYDTQIEQGGTNVSGGQRQRLCIARALLKSPKVLILDDSTSAVDTATDAAIQRAFAEQIPDTTKLIISQRTSSFASCDRIIVMSGGAVVAFAPEDELIETCDIYREVYETQNSEGYDADFDFPPVYEYDPVSQRYDRAFADELEDGAVPVEIEVKLARGEELSDEERAARRS